MQSGKVPEHAKGAEGILATRPPLAARSSRTEEVTPACQEREKGTGISEEEKRKIKKSLFKFPNVLHMKKNDEEILSGPLTESNRWTSNACLGHQESFNSKELKLNQSAPNKISHVFPKPDSNKNLAMSEGITWECAI